MRCEPHRLLGADVALLASGHLVDVLLELSDAALVLGLETLGVALELAELAHDLGQGARLLAHLTTETRVRARRRRLQKRSQRERGCSQTHVQARLRISAESAGVP